MDKNETDLHIRTIKVSEREEIIEKRENERKLK